MHRAKRTQNNGGLTAVELAAVLLVTVVLAVVLLPMLTRAREAKLKASCQENFRQLGLAFKMYAKESRGEIYPPPQYFTDGTNKSFAMSPMVDSIYPDYIEDVRVLFCPSTQRQSYKNVTDGSGNFVGNIPDYEGGKASLMDQDYIYMAWAVNENFYTEPVAIGKEIGNLLDVDENIHVPFAIKLFFPVLSNAIATDFTAETLDKSGNLYFSFGKPDNMHIGDRRFFRTREGVGRFFITDCNGPHCGSRGDLSLPLLFERSYSSFHPHTPMGRHILFAGNTMFYMHKGSHHFFESVGALPYSEESFWAMEKLADVPAENFVHFPIESLMADDITYLGRNRNGR